MRRTGDDVEVLLVHRPRYDDWSFPKGKLDPGEHPAVAAVREVEEETGLRVVLGVPLPRQEYAVGNGEQRTKIVHFWTGRLPPCEDGRLARDPDDEIDEVRWLPVTKAGKLLTYPHDAALLDEALRLRRSGTPLIVLRHGKAFPRKDWRDDDRARPLAQDGRAQSEALVPVLSAYGVRRVLSSTSTRCVATVAPFAEAAGLDLHTTDDLSEEDATSARVGFQVGLLVGDEPAVLCTHRPVLPAVFEALGVPDPKLAPGQALVVHLRKGAAVATELLDSAG